MSSAVSVSRVIAVQPEQLYGLVSDLPRMGEWSPENTGGKWKGSATGPAVGAKFVGANRNGSKQWTTLCTVTEATLGKVFGFDVTAAGFKVASWRYDFEPVGGGTRVTETWTDNRGVLARLLGKPVSGVGDRAAHNRAGMERTLQALATAVGE